MQCLVIQTHPDSADDWKTNRIKEGGASGYRCFVNLCPEWESANLPKEEYDRPSLICRSFVGNFLKDASTVSYSADP